MINHSESARSKRETPSEDQWAEYLDNSLLYKRYTTSKVRAEFVAERQQATSRRKTAEARRNYRRTEWIDCPGVGCLASNFMEAVAAELAWWPAAWSAGRMG